MAITANNERNEIVRWQTRVLREYRRGNLFSPYMGDSPTSIIQFIRDLDAEQGGDQVNIPFVGRLNGPGVSTGPLTGNEEKLDSYGMRAWIDWSRNAVLLKRSQLRKTAYDQLEVVRPLLTEWGKGNQRDEIILALDALPSETVPQNLGNDTVGGQRVNGILYSAATAAQKNTFVQHNVDRVLFGNSVGNYSSTMATALANIDATNDRLTAASLLLLKRRARAADPGITPYMTKQGREYFVAFAGANAFRDLAADATIQALNRDARPRDVDENPLFQDGDLLYRGVIVREIPEIDTLATKTGAGAGGTVDVTPVFMCGQGALGFVWGQEPRPTERKEDDYGMLIGRGVEMAYGIAKIFRKIGTTSFLKQHGVATGYFASVNDA